MYIVSVPLGRLGNALFRHFASVLFCILYGAKRLQHLSDLTHQPLAITDDQFQLWMKETLERKPPMLDVNATYAFFGYFQHDTIYVQYREAILEYMRHNPDDLLITDGKTPQRPEFTYPPVTYTARDLMTPPPNLRRYDVVVHLRLEDFLQNDRAIHPDTVCRILHQIAAPLYCLVVNPPTTDLEKAYIQYIQDRFQTVLESNDVLTDFHILKHATTLVCSRSTIGWAAAFMSSTLKTLYMPDITNREPHETFKAPIPDTRTYTYTTCSKDELRALFSGTSQQSLKKPTPYTSTMTTAAIKQCLKDAHVSVAGALQVGANTYDELGLYQQLGLAPSDVVWIEANPEYVQTARNRNIPNVYNAVLSDTDTNGTTTLDRFNLAHKVNISKHTLWTLNVQGQELKTLSGGLMSLKFVKVLYVKNVKDSLKAMLDYILSAQGFTCKLTHPSGNDFSEAVYIRTPVV
jgi:hypothetical protein